MEVIYTGLFQTPEMIVRAAIDEDVDVVGLSILSGAHLMLIPAIVDGLRKAGRADALVIAGGTIPRQDETPLRSAGVSAVFGPGTPIDDVVTFIREHAAGRTAESS
jgi:methylmalonyl-CoA mutase C-terminal domain/subunit